MASERATGERLLLSYVVDATICEALMDSPHTGELSHTEFSDLISMGELVDRLAIVNIKLYNLKNQVIQNSAASPEVPAEWYKQAATYDVRLCEERSRIKACIDKKLLSMIRGGAEPIEEFKSYK